MEWNQKTETIRNRPSGRPVLSPTGEAQKAYTVKIIPSLRDRLVKKFGSLSKALQFLDNQSIYLPGEKAK